MRFYGVEMIEKVTIKIGKKRLKLSLNEAIELRDELNRLTDHNGYWWPPRIIEHHINPRWESPPLITGDPLPSPIEVWCDGTTDAPKINNYLSQ
jgi:hypothetical protein